MMSGSSLASGDHLKQRLVAAMRLHVDGKNADAQSAYEALLADYPGQPDILHALGTIHLQAQRWEAAADYFQKALAANPRQSRHMLPLAQAYAQAKQPEKATAVLAKLLALDSDRAEASNLLHDLCLAENASMKRLAKDYPKNIGVRSVAARLAQTVGDYAERLVHLDALYALGVRTESFYCAYTLCLSQNARFDRCLTVCKDALAAYPGSLGVLKMRANVYTNLGRYDEALAEWARVVAQLPGDAGKMTPEDHASHVAIGIIKLLTSDCREGYEEYAAHRDYAMVKEALVIPLPEWHGESLKDKRLLLWSSQGIGDVVMFASLLPWVMAQGAQITLALYPKMIPLFARSFPGVGIIPYSKNNLQVYASKCDLQAVFGQLMAYGVTHYTPAQHPPFLKVDAAKTQSLREKYLALRPPGKIKKLVGISWHTINYDTAGMRNIPLAEWSPLFLLPDIQYVSLQYGDHAAEIEAVGRTFPNMLHVDPDIDAFENIDGLAAQMAAMDEIISVQNSTVHLAGALGVKTTLMLCAASDWRWGLKRSDSRWYESVHIERQEKLLDWQPVLQRVRERLTS